MHAARCFVVALGLGAITLGFVHSAAAESQIYKTLLVESQKECIAGCNEPAEEDKALTPAQRKKAVEFCQLSCACVMDRYNEVVTDEEFNQAISDDVANKSDAATNALTQKIETRLQAVMGQCMDQTMATMP